MPRPALLLLVPALLLVTGCQAPQPTPDQQLALRQAQTRQLEIPYPTVFQSTITYLQDNAYQIRQASKDSNVISAYKSQDVSSGAKFWGAFWLGSAGKKGDTYEATFTYEPLDEQNTQVRLNITHGVFNLGGHNTDVQPVRDPMLYKNVLDALALEAQRKHLANQMRAKQAVPVVPAASAP